MIGKMIDKEKIKETVKDKFTEYMTLKGYRKTPERYAILEQIYSLDSHFDIEMLYEIMSNSRCFRVSKATVYNTVELLLNCDLVVKHQFGKTRSYYEKSYNNDNHYHLICTKCHEIRGVKSNDISRLIKNKKIAKFKPTHYNIYIYGICSTCSASQRKNIKDNKKI